MKDILQWSPLQVRVTMEVANAKFAAFAEVATYAVELTQLGLLSRTEAADLLQEVAEYNRLPFEYGQDRIQHIMSAAFSGVAA